jgi:hypothetical protein
MENERPMGKWEGGEFGRFLLNPNHSPSPAQNMWFNVGKSFEIIVSFGTVSMSGNVNPPCLNSFNQMDWTAVLDLRLYDDEIFMQISSKIIFFNVCDKMKCKHFAGFFFSSD